MRAQEFLTERISSIVYHYTNIAAARKILRSGEFELSSAMGSVEQQYMPPGQYYFLSTTRTRTGGYHQVTGSAGALFVLDGDWFNQRYRGHAVDYWLNRNPQVAHHRRHEAEDRIFSREPIIPIDGVTAVHVYVSPDAEEKIRVFARQALIAAKRRGIPTYFYDDQDAWRSLNTARTAKPVLPGQDQLRGYVSPPRDPDSRLFRDYMKAWVELIQANSKDQLSKEADGIRYGFHSAYNRNNAARGLSTELSNARKPSEGIERKRAATIIQYMRQQGFTKVSELVDALADKWQNLK
jgi:hypothetical protein